MISTFKKLIFILNPSDRFRALRLLFIMLIAVLLETLGISLILPITSIMIEEDITQIHPLITNIYIYFESPTKGNLISFFVILMIAIFLIKNFFLGFFYWKQFSFIADMTVNLGKKLLSKYLSLPYSEHTKKNSSIYIRNTTREVGHFNSLLYSSLTLVIEVLMLIFISLLLFIVEPVIFLFAILSILSTAYLLFYFTKNRTVQFGKDRLYHEGRRIYAVQETIGAIRDVVITGKEQIFLNEFDFHNRKTAINERNYEFIKSLPKLFIEIIAILIFAVIIYASLNYTVLSSNLLPLLGLFAAAAIKLMPSTNRIIASFQAIKYNNATVNTLNDELRFEVKTEERIESSKVITFNTSLKLNNLTFGYDSSRHVLENINLEINQGAIIGLIGESGSGKSTLIDLIVGFIKPLEGEIMIDNVNIHSNLREWQNKIGYVSQNVFILDDTLKNNIVFGEKDDEINFKLLEKAIAQSQLSDFVSSLAEGVDTNVGERGAKISGGQRQRIAIARALYSNPSFLIFDESTNALDIETESQIMNVIHELRGKKTSLIVSHRLSTIENCDIVLKLVEGKLQRV